MTDFLKTNVVDDSVNKCTWNMGSECSGNVATRAMFKQQLNIPICDQHYVDHVTLMVLNHAYKIHIETAVEMSMEQRAEELKKLTDHSELNESVMRQALEKINQDVPEDDEELFTAFAKNFA